MLSSRNRGKKIDGILLLDKPVGITSSRALQLTSRLFGARKAGHTGSLDPLATGMLPICFGEATKISGFLLNSDKAYTVTAQLGVATDTGDADGAVTGRLPIGDIDRAAIAAVLSRFRGDLQQVPPMYSALRHQGQRLYKLAREGQTVPRKPRPIRIHKNILQEYTGDSFTLYVECSKGTYIRTLVTDMGEALACGAHVTHLRREWVHPFSGPMYSLEQLKTQSAGGEAALSTLLLPIDAGLTLPTIRLEPQRVRPLLSGQTVACEQARELDALYSLCDHHERFLGVGICSRPGKLAPKRLIHTSGDGQPKVFTPNPPSAK